MKIGLGDIADRGTCLGDWGGVAWSGVLVYVVYSLCFISSRRMRVYYHKKAMAQVAVYARIFFHFTTL